MEEEKDKAPNAGPVFQKKLGSIRIAVFENTTKDGRMWHNVRITRQFRRGEGWGEAPTFNGLADLALVEEGIRQAKAWLNEQVLVA